MDILFVEDHALVREGVKRILAGAPELQVAGEAVSGVEAIALLGARRWDFMLLDISLPGISGMEVLRLAREIAPEMPVLVLSMHAAHLYARRVRRAGAGGYVMKEDAPRELIPAIREVAAGGRFFPAEPVPGSVESRALECLRSDDRPRIEPKGPVM